MSASSHGAPSVFRNSVRRPFIPQGAGDENCADVRLLMRQVPNTVSRGEQVLHGAERSFPLPSSCASHCHEVAVANALGSIRATSLGEERQATLATTTLVTSLHFCFWRRQHTRPELSGSEMACFDCAVRRVR